MMGAVRACAINSPVALRIRCKPARNSSPTGFVVDPRSNFPKPFGGPKLDRPGGAREKHEISVVTRKPGRPTNHSGLQLWVAKDDMWIKPFREVIVLHQFMHSVLRNWNQLGVPTVGDFFMRMEAFDKSPTWPIEVDAPVALTRKSSVQVPRE